jgi:hypothetical protein
MLRCKGRRPQTRCPLLIQDQSFGDRLIQLGCELIHIAACSFFVASKGTWVATLSLVVALVLPLAIFNNRVWTRSHYMAQPFDMAMYTTLFMAPLLLILALAAGTALLVALLIMFVVRGMMVRKPYQLPFSHRRSLRR